MDAQYLTIVGIVPALGFGFAGLGIRTTPRLAEGRTASTD